MAAGCAPGTFTATRSSGSVRGGAHVTSGGAAAGAAGIPGCDPDMETSRSKGGRPGELRTWGDFFAHHITILNTFKYNKRLKKI